MATDYHFVGPFGSDFPHAVVGPGIRAGERPRPDVDEVLLARVPAHSWDAAVALLAAARRDGIARTVCGKHGPTHAHGRWTFPGMGRYLADAAIRLGVSTGSIGAAERQGPVVEVGRKLGECLKTYQAARGRQAAADRDFSIMEKRHVEGLVLACDGLSEQLHMMADATRAAIEDCRAAFGMGPGEYRHGIVTARERRDLATNGSDLAALQAELDNVRADNGRLAAERAAAVADAEMAAGNLRAEVGRLAADNAELLAQNKQLAAMVEQLTAPAPAPVPVEAPAPAAEPKPATANPAPQQPRNKGR